MYRDQEYVSDYGITMLSDNGMPLKTGDQFKVTFSQRSPRYHEIDYEIVSSATMRRYLEIAAKRLQFVKREEWQDLDQSQKNIRSLCICLLLFEQEGYNGLSKIYFHDVNPLDNFSHNQWSWYFLAKSESLNILRPPARPTRFLNPAKSILSC
ncbi:MAG: hypothetical protein U5L96_04640 [Owenweeksia sp.]|nr:hypothetical protein [Owenweeksia sp.]